MKLFVAIRAVFKEDPRIAWTASIVVVFFLAFAVLSIVIAAKVGPESCTQKEQVETK